jgi:hypothetical protein
MIKSTGGDFLEQYENKRNFFYLFMFLFGTCFAVTFNAPMQLNFAFSPGRND